MCLLCPFTLYSTLSGWLCGLHNTVRQRIFSAVFTWLAANVLQPMLKPIKEEFFSTLDSCRQSSGAPLRLLEIGVGPGPNLRYYPNNTELIAVEPNPHFKPPTAPTSKITSIQHICSGAEDMSAVPSGSVDVVVSTYVLCTVESPEQAIQEISRVLRPGGKFYFFEHVTFNKQVYPLMRLAQKLWEPVWTYLSYGCHFRPPTHLLLEKSHQTTGLMVDWHRARMDLITGLYGLLIWPTYPHELGVAVKELL